MSRGGGGENLDGRLQDAGTAGMEQGGVMGEVARRVLERLARLCGGSGISSGT